MEGPRFGGVPPRLRECHDGGLLASVPTDRDLADRAAAAYAAGARSHPSTHPRSALDDSGGILRRATGLPVPYFSWLYVVDDAVTVDDLTDAVRWFDDRDQPFTARLREHQVTRCDDALRRLGFTPEIVMPGMVATPVPEPGLRIDVDGLEVVPVTDDRTYFDFTARVAPGGVPAWLTTEVYRDFMPPEIADDPAARYVVGYVDGRPVANAAGRVDDGVVTVFAVGTAEHLRRRGVGTAMTAAVLDWARGACAEVAFLTSSEMAQRMYASMGFRTVDTWHFYVRPWSGGS